MDPNEVKPAPGPLRVVQEFVNTRSNLRGSDLLEDAEVTARWLAGHGLFPDGVAEVPGQLRPQRRRRPAVEAQKQLRARSGPLDRHGSGR